MLQCHHLSIERQHRWVIDDLSVSFKPGTWTALVGPNGAGKSTLLQALAGLLPHQRGEILLNERPLASLSAAERALQLSWLSQASSISGDLLAWDVVMLARIAHHGLFQNPSAQDEQQVHAALAESEADRFSCRRIQTLSGGERQRVLLARLWAQQTPVLLLDEPLVHLDPPHQSQLVRSLKKRAAAGATVVTVLHELNQALLADRLLVLGPKGLVAEGAPQDTVVQHALIDLFEGSLAIETLAHNRVVAIPL